MGARVVHGPLVQGPVAAQLEAWSRRADPAFGQEILEGAGRPIDGPQGQQLVEMIGSHYDEPRLRLHLGVCLAVHIA